MARHVKISEDKHGFWNVTIKDGTETVAEKVFHHGDSTENLDAACDWAVETIDPEYQRRAEPDAEPDDKKG